jgi:hypothetical protein
MGKYWKNGDIDLAGAMEIGRACTIGQFGEPLALFPTLPSKGGDGLSRDKRRSEKEKE